MLLVETGLNEPDSTDHGNLKFGGIDIIKILWLKRVLSFCIIAPICPSLTRDHAFEYVCIGYKLI